MSAFNSVLTRTANLWIEETKSSQKEVRKNFRKRYWDLPDQFVKDCIEFPPGQGPAPYQIEILNAVVSKRRVCARGMHGLGKSALMSWAILWFALTRDGETDWKIPTTASAWRQLTKFLWPEVHKWSRKIRWELVGRDPFNGNTELLTMSLRLDTGEAFALASNDSSLIEGAHATELLYIFDESKVVPDETWDSAEGAMSTAGTRWLSVSTPGEPIGRFYDIQSRKPGYEDWWVRAVKTPEVVKAGRVDPEWVDQRRKQWGANSPRYQNRVLGEFAESEQDSVIPLSWVESAQERWSSLMDAKVDAGPLSQLGVDVGRYGDDATVIAHRHGNIIAKMDVYEKEDTMATAGRVASILRSNPTAIASIDVIGIGAGVYDKAREDFPERVIAFNSSRGTEFVDKSDEWRFADTRSAAIWHLRELLDPANEHDIAIPDDDMLTGDLVSPRWSPISGGRIKVESKKDIYKRIGRSTNHGDAVVAAFWDEDAEGGMEFA